MDEKPIKGLDISVAPAGEGESPSSPIPRKRKSPKESNGHGLADGEEAVHTTNGVGGTKRSADEALGLDSVDAKRSKISSDTNGASLNGAHEAALVIDDLTDGAILIDDD